MGSYMIGLDQSTQGTKAILFNDLGNIVYKHARSHTQLINDQGWVSHDLDEIYGNVIQLINDLVEHSHVPVRDIAGVGISVQRETAAAWARDTGNSLANAIVWQDARAAAITNQLTDAADKVKAKTGLPLSPYFTAAKFAWLLQNVPAVKQAADTGNLCLGTMDSWLLYRLTRGQAFKTEPSNASRTQLFNIHTVAWDAQLCQLFGVPQDALAAVVSSNALFGETTFDGIFPQPIPIHCMLGDSQAALYGHGCTAPGDVKATIGTGSSVMMNIGDQPIQSADVVTSIGWRINGRTAYVAEGNINYAGAVIKWLTEDVQLIQSAAEAEPLARQAVAADQTYLIPAFSGLGAPYWDATATATLTGMTRTTGRAEIIRAALDSIAYQISDILAAIDQKAGQPATTLKVDGGVTANSYLMQFLSNIANVTVSVPDIEELSAFGVAYCAGRALTVYGQLKLNTVLNYHHYQNAIDDDQRQNLLAGWHRAVRGVCHEEAAPRNHNNRHQDNLMTAAKS